MEYLDVVIPVLVGIVLLYFLIYHLKDFLFTVRVFFKTFRNEMRSEVLRYIDNLLSMNPEVVKRVITHDVIVKSLTFNLKNLVKEYTAVYRKEQSFGIYKKVATKYYLDLQKPCVSDKHTLERLGALLSFHIIENCPLYLRAVINRIVAQACGNILLASKVSEILGIPLLIAGNLEGKENAIFGNWEKGENIIIVDDIVSSGGMLIKSLEIVEDSGLNCEYIFALVKRTTQCDVEIAKFCTAKGKEIKLIPYMTLLDHDMENIFKQKGELV